MGNKRRSRKTKQQGISTMKVYSQLNYVSTVSALITGLKSCCSKLVYAGYGKRKIPPMVAKPSV